MKKNPWWNMLSTLMNKECKYCINYTMIIPWLYHDYTMIIPGTIMVVNNDLSSLMTWLSDEVFQIDDKNN